jgi:hypothetical protein
MAYNGAGSIFALGARITKLDAAGAPLVGASNAYVTEALISANIGNTYSEPDAITLTNGQGQTCVHYQPSAVLLGGTLEEFRFCQPDPNILQFLAGGEVLTTGGTNEVQTVTITGTPTGGTFTLTFSGQTTSSIAYNAIAATVRTALEGLSNINPGDVTVAGGPLPGTAATVTFTGQYSSTDVAQMTATGSFTGGTSPAVAVTTTTPGVAGTSTTGYRAPLVNTDPTPNGVSIELWSRAVLDNSLLPGGIHWVLPRAKLRPSEGMALGSEDPLQPVFSGTLEQNANFGDGPIGDIDFPTDRVWQFNYNPAAIPTLSTGMTTVIADA